MYIKYKDGRLEYTNNKLFVIKVTVAIKFD